MTSDAREQITALTDCNELLRRRLERERRTRRQAEEIGEQGLLDLYQQRRALEFLSEISIMANEAVSARAALAPVLEYMCRFTGWPAAHAYIAVGEGSRRVMQPSNIWYVDPGLDLSEFRSETTKLDFAIGTGLPGQIWESGAPLWVEDLATCDNLPRRDAARRSGMRSAFSTPLMVGSDVAGSIEFFRPDPMPADTALLGLIAKAGTQLGRMIERDNANARIARALADSERANALLRANADALMDPQVLLEGVRDADGRVVDLIYRDVNRATGQNLGLSRDQLIGHSCLESLPNLERSGLLAHFVRCAESQEPLALDEFPYRSERLGGLRYYDFRAAYAGSDSISLTWRDVTDRATATQRIAASEQRYRLLAENVGDVVSHVRDGRFVWVSPSIDKALGTPPGYWLGRELSEIVPPQDRPAQMARLRELARDGNLVARGRVLGTDGTLHWVRLHATTFHDANGNPDGITASFRIVDAEVEAMRAADEARLQQAETDARYRKLTEHSAVGMCLVTPHNGRYEVVNQALCDFHGYDADAMLAKTWQELTAAEYLEADQDNVHDLLAGRLDSYRMTKQYIHADGHLIWGDLTVSCVRNPRGEVEHLIAQIIDVTAEVEARSRVAQREQQNRVLARRLQEQTDRLMSELKSAARYVESILPGELDGPVRASSRYLPSRELAGDCFDYSWIDDDHLIVYLIDVSGHGIEAALVSISVHNLLRSKSLAAETLLEPDRLLTQLNALFDMDRHDGNYFTMWYGVYEASSRTLRYASAGHPPALLFTAGQGTVAMARLTSESIPIGMLEDAEFLSATCTLPPGSQLLLYSDGAYELPMAAGRHWSVAEFASLCTVFVGEPGWSLDALVSKLRSLTVGGLFEDDCSLVRLTFD